MTTDLPSILERGKELAAKAAGVGTWQAWVVQTGLQKTPAGDEACLVHGAGPPHEWRDPNDRSPVNRAADDAAYIVHACNTWPLLAAEVERLQRKIDEIYKEQGWG